MLARRITLTSMVLLAFACSFAAAEENVTPEPPEWREFHYAERGFVVSFPGITSKPRAVSTPVSGQNPLLQHDYRVNADDDTVYSVVVFEYPEGRGPYPPKPNYFAKVVSAYAEGSGTRVRKKGTKTIDDRPGYEAIAEDGRGRLNHLVDLVANGDRVYMLVSAGTKGHAKSDAAKRFRDSFRLLGGPPPPGTARVSAE